MYIIRNRNLAGAISFLSKENFKLLEDNEGDGKVYGFEETDKLHTILDELTKLRNKINN